MGKKLLIVESPAKAKTIGKYLGPEFTVRSSVGHIRDLPKENGAIRIDKTGDESWTFTPKYEISEGKEKVVSELKSAVKSSSEVYLASDPDREGEAIAWHLREVLERVAGKKPFLRVTYNEITSTALSATRCRRSSGRTSRAPTTARSPRAASSLSLCGSSSSASAR